MGGMGRRDMMRGRRGMRGMGGKRDEMKWKKEKEEKMKKCMAKMRKCFFPKLYAIIYAFKNMYLPKEASFNLIL